LSIWTKEMPTIKKLSVLVLLEWGMQTKK